MVAPHLDQNLPTRITAHKNKQLIPDTQHHASGINGAELAQVNWCQIYLNATTLADLCNGLGAYILPDMWAGKPNQMFTSHRIPMAKSRMTDETWLDTMAACALTSLPSQSPTTTTATTGWLAQCPTTVHPPMALDDILCYTKALPLGWPVENTCMTQRIL